MNVDVSEMIARIDHKMTAGTEVCVQLELLVVLRQAFMYLANRASIFKNRKDLNEVIFRDAFRIRLQEAVDVCCCS